MNVGEFLDAFRRRTGDTAKPYLWADEEVLRYAAAAEAEACIRAHLISDSSTASIRQLAVTAGTADVPLSPLVLHVTRARLSASTMPLQLTTVDRMEDEEPTWESRAAATPTRLVLYRTGTKVTTARLWPTPIANGTLLLTVVRLPLRTAFDDGEQTFEIPAQYHERLLDWVERCAYLKKDAETLDIAASEAAEARFDASFGRFQDANVMRKQAERSTWQVAMNPF